MIIFRQCSGVILPASDQGLESGDLYKSHPAGSGQMMLKSHHRPLSARGQVNTSISVMSTALI